MDKRHHVIAWPSRRRARTRARVRTAPAHTTLRLVDEARAAALLGITAEELRRLSCETGLGHAEQAEGGDQFVFTYAEIYRLCKSAVLVAD